jgi:hypothetical protein
VNWGCGVNGEISKSYQIADEDIVTLPDGRVCLIRPLITLQIRCTSALAVQNIMGG